MFDLVLAVILLSAAAGGYRLGLVARLGSWAGLLIGFAIGITFGPSIADSLSDGGGPGLRFLFTAVAVVGPALIGQGIGLQFGGRLRRQVPAGLPRRADMASGAVAGVFGFLVSLWLFLPVLGGVPAFAAAARDSAIVAFVDDASPDPPASFRDLRTFVAQSPFPEVFGGMGRAPEASPPPSELPLSAAVADRVAASTVNIEARGCGGIQEGSGFVAGPGLVATNAHVVAGTETIEAIQPGGRRVPLVLVAFDDDRDVAILRGGVDAPALPFAPVAEGAPVAVFGHPDGQDQLRIAPAVVDRQVTARGRDIYSRDRVERQVLILGASIRQGDSGAAVVDADGAVVGQAFAVAPDRSSTAYALTAGEVQAVLGVAGEAGVGSGACQRR